MFLKPLNPMSGQFYQNSFAVKGPQFFKTNLDRLLYCHLEKLPLSLVMRHRSLTHCWTDQGKETTECLRVAHAQILNRRSCAHCRISINQIVRRWQSIPMFIHFTISTTVFFFLKFIYLFFLFFACALC